MSEEVIEKYNNFYQYYSIDEFNLLLKVNEQLKKQLRENWDKQEEKENLVKHLEDSIKLCQNDIKKLSENYNVYSFEINDIRARLSTYQDILERLKNNNYEN